MKNEVTEFAIWSIIIFFILTNVYAADKNNTRSEVIKYINKNWNDLTRDLSYSAKLSLDKSRIIYISINEDIKNVRFKLALNLSEEDANKIDVRYLPKNLDEINLHGLLYLPYPYVVPGGRFNEMFGWDSYFIELGLLESHRFQLAKNMIDNLIYEINYYGTLLNANGTEYINRSHPPVLTLMILEYFNQTHDKLWLKSTLPAIKKLYHFWNSSPHLIPEIELSRYYAGGRGPTPEEDPEYYKKALYYYQTHEVSDYNKSDYYDDEQNKLKDLFFIADRTVRESGFDISAKYGPFGAAILDYAPVDLNVLLFRMEKDISKIHRILNNKKLSVIWQNRARKRAKLINQYMWNEKLGYYFDYNFKTHQQKEYIYATTFYPLWAGLASKEQASKIANNLPKLLGKGGLVTSVNNAKLQWDAPFGWAPLQYFAVSGLEQYGYHKQAKTIATRFIHTIDLEFKKNHCLFEKYDVLDINVDSKDKIDFGYATNEVGFGWTNGVYLKLLKMSQSKKRFA